MLCLQCMLVLLNLTKNGGIVLYSNMILKSIGKMFVFQDFEPCQSFCTVHTGLLPAWRMLEQHYYPTSLPTTLPTTLSTTLFILVSTILLAMIKQQGCSWQEKIVLIEQSCWLLLTCLPLQLVELLQQHDSNVVVVTTLSCMVENCWLNSWWPSQQRLALWSHLL